LAGGAAYTRSRGYRAQVTSKERGVMRISLVVSFMGLVLVPCAYTDAHWSIFAGMREFFKNASYRENKPEQEETQVGVLHIVGSISSALDHIKNIYTFAQNPRIKAVLVHIDSGGGSGTSSQMVAQELQKLGKKKPVVVFIENMCASGAYWIASAANIIVAESTSVIGSIGVVNTIRRPKNLFFITAGKFKRPAFGDDQRLETEYEAYEQTIVNDMYAIFCQEIATNRDLSFEVVKDQEARVFIGQKALEIGLIDKIGNMADALDAIRGLLMHKMGPCCSTLKLIDSEGETFMIIKDTDLS